CRHGSHHSRHPRRIRQSDRRAKSRVTPGPSPQQPCHPERTGSPATGLRRWGVERRTRCCSCPCLSFCHPWRSRGSAVTKFQFRNNLVILSAAKDPLLLLPLPFFLSSLAQPRICCYQIPIPQQPCHPERSEGPAVAVAVAVAVALALAFVFLSVILGAAEDLLLPLSLSFPTGNLLFLCSPPGQSP